MELKEIIMRCQQGDREAMGLLYTAMHDELLHVCRHYVADGSMADDLLHDAFLLIFCKIGDLRSPARAKEWMHKVVKNVSLLYLKKQQQQHDVPLDQVIDEAENVATSANAITYDELMSYVDALPLGYREVFHLSVLEGLTHKEIAALLNIEPHSASSQLYRAKRVLQQSLRVLLLCLLAVLIPIVIYRIAMHRKPAKDGLPPFEARDVTANDSLTESAQEPIAPPKPEEGGRKPEPAKDEGQGPEPAKAGEWESEPANEESIEALPDAEPADTTTTRQPDDLPTERPEMYSPRKSRLSRWQLALTYSGLPNGSSQSLPYGAEGVNDEADSVCHHRLPLTISLDASYRVGRHLWLNGGLRYTLLSSEHRVGNTYLYYSGEQKVRYLGVNLGAGYNLLRTKALTFYGQASATLDFPLRSNLHTTYIVGPQILATEDARLSPAAQWSLGTGLGLQYNITPAVGFFVEPSLHYFFHTGDGIDTWRTEHPVSFSLPFGARINF